ncbi:MAG: hypothetical protein Q3985_03620 [Eubacteriales bacterium]|nr:hypothetical protein [Eubacteriales bacterium]
MKFEIQKLYGNRWVLCLFSIIIILNGLLFRQHCLTYNDEYTLQQVAKAYVFRDSLDIKLNELEACINGAGNIYEEMISDNIYTEYELLKETAQRVEQATNYSDYIQKLQNENNAKMDLRLFEENTFEYKSVLKSLSTYQKMEALTLPVAFSGGIERLSDFAITDIFLLLFGCTPAFLIVASEFNSGQILLLRPTKNGRLVLFLRKYGAVVLCILVGAMTLYGTNVLLAKHQLGLMNLSWPVQSVFGFQACPYRLSIREYLLAFFGIKLLWALMFTSLFFAFCAICRRYTNVFVVMVAFIGISGFLQNTPSLWLRTIHLLTGLKTHGLFDSCVFLNFFNIPLPRAVVQSMEMLFATFVFQGTGAITFCKRSSAPSKRNDLICLHRPSLKSTRLLRHEFYKAFITNGALVLLVGFALLQTILYQNYPVRQDRYEYYYHYYSQILSGSPSAQKDDYIKETSARFEEAHQQLSELLSTLPENGIISPQVQKLQAELQREFSFQMAQLQYSGLKDNMRYVYKSGYEQLWGNEGLCDDLLDTVKLSLILSILLSAIFSADTYYGIDKLQCSAGMKQRVFLYKSIVASTILIVAAIIAYAPQYVAIAVGYGYPELLAPARSLDIFFNINEMWSLQSMLHLRGLAQFLVATSIAAIVICTSRRKTNPMTAVLLAVIVTCVPVLTIYVLIT